MFFSISEITSKLLLLATFQSKQLPPQICGRSGCVPNRIIGNESNNYLEFVRTQNRYIAPKRIIMGLFEWNFEENKWQKIFSTSTKNVSELFYEVIFPINDQDALYCINLKKELARMKTVLKLMPLKNNEFFAGGDRNIYQVYYYLGQYNLHQSTSGYIPFGFTKSNSDVKILVYVELNWKVSHVSQQCLVNI